MRSPEQSPTAPGAAAVPLHRLWFALLAPPLAWTVQGMLGVYVSDQACVDGEPGWGPLSGLGIRLIDIGLTVVAVSICAVALLTAWRAWRRTTADAHLRDGQGWGRADFLALSGVIVAASFLLGLVWAGLPAFVVNMCGNVR